MSAAEDPRTAARRIVAEVLASHERRSDVTGAREAPADADRLEPTAEAPPGPWADARPQDGESPERAPVAPDETPGVLETALFANQPEISPAETAAFASGGDAAPQDVAPLTDATGGSSELVTFASEDVVAPPEPSPSETEAFPPQIWAAPDVADLQSPDWDPDAPETADPAANPEPEPARRTGRWLVTTVLAAVAVAWLLPMAVAALRDLVALS